MLVNISFVKSSELRVTNLFVKTVLITYCYWQKHDPKKTQRIEKLLDAILKDPFNGIGKPEPLRFNFSGYWSRRIDQNHRLVYKIHDDTLYIAQCRYHYEK